MNAWARMRSFERVRVALDSGPAPGYATDLAVVASRLTGADGTGVSLGGDSRDGQVLSTVFANGVAEDAEMVQATLGEGPAYTARRTHRPVMIPDLAGQRTWALFGNAAEQLGIRAVFAVPLSSGSEALGAISFYRQRPGHPTDAEWEDAQTVAALTIELLAGPDGLDQDMVLLAGEPDASTISQAIGMVAAQLRADMGTALALLRARAIGADRSLREVAREVLAGDLHLADGG